MSKPKFTVVLDDKTLAYYKARAAREDRTPSYVMRRVLRDAAGVPSDPEEGAKVKLKMKP